MILMTDVTTSPLFTNDSKTGVDYGSWNLPLSDRRFPISTTEKSWLIGGLFVGCLVGVAPLTSLMSRFGAHQILIGIGVSVSLLTAAVPFVASAGVPFLVVHRILHGIVMSNIFPIIGAIIRNWSTPSEHGLFISLLTGHLQISMIIATPLSGIVGSRFGWPAITFVSASLSAMITLAWALFYRNDPADHPFISSKEILEITQDKKTSERSGEYKPPYKKIFTSLPIWAVWIATAGNYIVSQFPITFYFMFLVSALELDVETAGVLSAVPFISQIIVKFITGLITDRISFISELNKCRLFNSLAFYGGAISFLLVTFLKPQNKLLCAFVTMIPQAMIGFNPGGFNKSAIVVPAQFSPTVLAVIQVVLCFSLFLGSFVVPFLTPTGSFEEYSTVFVIYAVILVVSNTFFVIFCSVEPAEWTKENGGKKKGKILEWTSQGQNSSRNTDIQNAQ